VTRIRVDMHTHCEASRDSRTPVRVQAARIKEVGLDVVCATDHDTIEGALRLRELADGYRIVVGEEVSSADGDLIGLFLERPVPPGLSGEETIARIREQGGLVCVPHPFSRNRRFRIRRAALERLWPHVDCVETFNAREAFAQDNRRAAAFAAERAIPAALGSDAHTPWELGRAYLEMDDFADATGFLAALRGGAPHGTLAGLGVHVRTRYDRLRKWLGARR
jgi:predicted metal-dependent phosphoesterase TrpH